MSSPHYVQVSSSSPIKVNGFGSMYEGEAPRKKKKNRKHKHEMDCGAIQEGHQDEKQGDTVLVEKAVDLLKKKKQRKHGHEKGNGAITVINSVTDEEVKMKKGPSSKYSSGSIREEEGSQVKQKNKKRKHDKDCGGIQEGDQDEKQYDIVLVEKDLQRKKKKRKHNHERDTGANTGINSLNAKEEVKKKGPSNDNIMKNVDDSTKDKKKKKKIQKELLAAEAEQPKKSSGVHVREFVASEKNGDSGGERIGVGVNRLEDAHGDKKKTKKKGKSVKSGFESGLQENAKPKKVSFNEHVQVFPSFDRISDTDQRRAEELVQGKRFTEEEDELVRDAVDNYIEAHGLGAEGLHKVLHCKQYPEVKNCWKEIGAALPWRPYPSVYYRAHVIFERSEKRSWTPEECEFVREHVEKHGPQWKLLAEELGKHRLHVKDTWRRIKLLNQKQGRWSQEEYQKLFDLVNVDLRMKASEEKKLKHGMLRDNICWGAISDKHLTRHFAACCMKWYKQLASPMVEEGIWADSDDYRLLDALSDLDACCIEDVDWDNLLEHRSGDICQKRWDQMVRYIGHYAEKSFAEQVEILADRYRPDLLEARVAYENKPAVDMP